MANMKRAREQSRAKLAKQDAEAEEQARMAGAVESATYVPHEFRAPDTATDETPEVAVFVNEHRETCIRVAVGRRKTTFIPMNSSGIAVKRVGTEVFKHDWRLTLADYSPAGAAESYLNSYAAKYYISNEARTLLAEISKNGAIHSTVKEQETMEATTTTKSTKSTKVNPAVVGKALKTANKPAPAKATGKAPSKAPAKAAPAKADSKAPAKTKGVPKAAPEATIKALFKVSEVAAREGTWTRFMIVQALTSKTVAEAQKKVDANKEFAGRRVDTNWLVQKGYIKLGA